MFKKYSEIENATQKNVDFIVSSGFSGGQWVVENKCHGSCFSLIVNKEGIQAARKEDIIGENEKFYNHKPVVEKYRDKAMALFNHLNKEKGYSEITIFGELFGGLFPNMKSEGTKIQSGIAYAPFNDFYSFDIFTHEDGYMNVLERNDLLERFGFFWAKPIFIGSFQECLSYPNMYLDPISEWLGLPQVEGNTNEGNVIKPLESKYFSDNSRVILKNKNSKWSEKVHTPKVKTEIVLSEEGDRLHNEILSYLNENRLHCVLSKLGEIKQNEFAKVMGAYSEDLWKDALKDNREAWETLPAEEQKKISKSVGQSTATLIRGRFNDILDGSF